MPTNSSFWDLVSKHFVLEGGITCFKTDMFSYDILDVVVDILIEKQEMVL